METVRVGAHHVDSVKSLVKRVMLNAAFLTNDDLGILEHLATKGESSKKRAVLINK